MKLLSNELIERILEEGEVIGEGSTRDIYMYDNRVFKIALDFYENENRNEVRIYEENKDYYNFLNKIYAYSEDYKIIEVEYLDCGTIDDLLSQKEYYGEYDVFIEEVIEEFSLESTLDYDFKDVVDFIHLNSLDAVEILLPHQWGFNKEGKLRISDYSR